MNPNAVTPLSLNPMLLQNLHPEDPRAQLMRQMMTIMGGLGNQVPPQQSPQISQMMPILGGIGEQNV